MLRQVDTKYSEICAVGADARACLPPRTGNATRYNPITVTKYLLRYCRTTSELKLRVRVLVRCESTALNLDLRT
jgi:hypothetical protein